jgi:cell pole-organizing protein PopZ
MVKKEPSSLSVFTSGSAFIHGVADGEKPGKEAAPPRKLDTAASELLRPMLRQWLSENMPRIVEEALRSELDSSQSAGEGTDKA